ncbi:glycosyltransferase [Methylophilaceae bacterium Uisw_097]
MNNSKKYKILLVFPHSSTVIANSEIWQKNIFQSLRILGHQVDRIDYDYSSFFINFDNKNWINSHSRMLENSIYKKVKKSKYDFVFSYLCNNFISIDFLLKIKDNYCPIINYSCNNTHQFYLVDEISQYTDLNIYTELSSKDKFINTNGYYLQMAANPAFYKRINFQNQFKYSVSFIGQNYADRLKTILSLIENDILVKVFGANWVEEELLGSKSSTFKAFQKIYNFYSRNNLIDTLRFLIAKVSDRFDMKLNNNLIKKHYGGVLPDSKFVDVVNYSKINLGLSNVFDGGYNSSIIKNHLKLRDFEIPMCGGFYITGLNSELELYYELCKEIEVYSSADELIDKIKFYLKNEKSRLKIAASGYNRAIKDHTWANRFSQLFSSTIFKSIL